jgi:hypothetical protein
VVLLTNENAPDAVLPADEQVHGGGRGGGGEVGAENNESRHWAGSLARSSEARQSFISAVVD